MTPEEQRIAIAEWCGIKWVILTRAELDVRTGTGYYVVYSPNGIIVATNLPDYLNELNAMHEAENRLRELGGEQARYIHELQQVCRRDAGKDYRADWHCPQAAAAQRAEALVITIGKWKE